MIAYQVSNASLSRINAALAAALLTIVPVASAQTSGATAYPTRALRFILPFPAGGGTDIVGRVLAQKLSEELGQPVVPDNRPGAGGNIGAEAAAKAAPDGYTLVICTVGLAVSPTLYKKLNYDAARDLAPIGLVASTPNALAVHPSMPARSVKEMVKLAQSGAGQSELRHRRRRHGQRSDRAGVQLVEPRRGADRPVQGHQPGDGGGALRRSRCGGGFGGQCRALVKSGKLRALATLAPAARAGAARRADCRAGGLPRTRSRAVVRRARAGRHAASRSSHA